MKLNTIIINCLSDRCGRDVTTPAGATFLTNDIVAKTGEPLAANTIKRLVGVLPYEYQPRSATLDILARYLGFSSWDIFLASLNDRISEFEGENPFIEIASLAPGTRIGFRWEPDREISLRHLGEGRCEVVDVVNSKLAVGDILTLSQLAEGYPLVVKDVARGGASLGSYLAAKSTGIADIIIN